MVTPKKRRYKVPGGRKRAANLHIKLSHDEKTRIEKMASDRMLTLSALIRHMAFGAQS
jgi:hypothetical protein